jgi:hypothetical protein
VKPFPATRPPRHPIFDRDAKCGDEVLAAIANMGIRAKQIAARSPWRNGVAERWVETVRRDLLNHVIVLNERHLQRLAAHLVAYCHDDRTRLSLEKQTPAVRTAATKPRTAAATVIALPRPGDLHHRCEWRAAAWTYSRSG